MTVALFFLLEWPRKMEKFEDHSYRSKPQKSMKMSNVRTSTHMNSKIGQYMSVWTSTSAIINKLAIPFYKLLNACLQSWIRTFLPLPKWLIEYSTHRSQCWFHFGSSVFFTVSVEWHCPDPSTTILAKGSGSPRGEGTATS